MITKEPAGSWDPFVWPCFLGGALTPLAGAVFERWMPPAIAGGLGVFVAWVAVGAAFSISPPTAKWSLTKWIAGGAAGAIVSTAVMLLLQDKGP